MQSQPSPVVETVLLENQISAVVTDAAIDVHRYLGGPGLLEGLYEECLAQELRLRGIAVQRPVDLPFRYKGITIRTPLRIDLLVGNKVIVEVKATEKDSPIYRAQLLTYLRLSGLKLGMLLNFGKRWMSDGMSRVVNGL